MKKILFENGKTIDGASTFNTMQDNVEDVFNGEEAMGSIVVEDISSKNLLDIKSYGKFNDFAFPNVFEYLDDGWMHYVNNAGIHEGLQFLSFKVKPSTKYIIKIEFADKTGKPIVMFRQRTGDTIVSTEYLYSSAVKTTESNTDNVLIALTTDSLNSQANSKVRIMVCEGDDTSVEYTPYNNFKNEEIYSLSEMKIGTWIDGKPLYRKTFIGTEFSNGTSVNMVTLISNVDTLCNYYGTVKSSDGVRWAIPFADITNKYLGRILHLLNNSVRLDVDKVQTYNKYKITLEYTKTTD